MTTSRRLVVSIHDVSPLTLGVVRKMREELRRWGVNQCSLLVIPNHHKKGRTIDSPETLAWLREAVAGGDEIILHGYFHKKVSAKAATPWDYLIANYYTAGEGEFHSLDYDTAIKALKTGDAELRSAGFNPQGFIAPAWLCGNKARDAVRAYGFAYTTYLGKIYDYTRNKSIPTQSLVWSVRAPWRRQMSLAWNQLLFWRNLRKDILRISLHPPDMTHPQIWNQVESLTRRALQTRQPATYLDCIKPTTD
ncbi:polysaccharide deacetylase family protein [Kamptonema cortianum]|nr:polysaccharide deacetylase family protein [Oscillatoria laete-virens]MDK3159613.1 polysaccharide deacetylase family protein [Kamptonema cortianum]MDL5055097.1 polysaccharide deacetylase family protein [Oscillatoria laete-virens NRMC-F 0139]